MSRQRVWAPRTHAGQRVPLAWVRLLSVYTALTRAMNANLLTAHGLTINDYEVLLRLSWAPLGRLSRGELADSVRLTQGGITRLLHGLERAGLVQSVGSESDRRVVYAQLTEHGHKRLEDAARTHVADVRTMFTDRFTTAELRTLAELLKGLSSAQPDAEPAPATQQRNAHIADRRAAGWGGTGQSE